MIAHHRTLISVLIVANLALAGYVLIRRYTSRATPSFVPVEYSQALPLVELRDDKGQTFSTKRFIGTPLFVQFIKSQVSAQIDSIAAVLANRPKRPISWLLITNNARELRAHLSNAQNDIVVVESGYKDLRKLFNVPECCETWLIFDEAGKLRDHGYYSDGGTASRLHHSIDGEQAYSPALLIKTINSIDGGSITQVKARAARSPSGKAVIVMYSSVCTGCPSGELIDILNTYAKRHDGIEYVALLPNTYTQADIKNFKVNLGVSFPVKVADERFSSQWMSFVERYGEAAVNNTVIVVDKGVLSIVQGISKIKHRLEELTKRS